MSTPQNDLETDESSGVTTLRPVPVKPARLVDLAECDSTQYFSASELLERGKALAAQPSPPAAPVAEPALAELESAPARSGLLGQLRRASLARPAIALLLPVLCGLLWLKPVFKKPAAPLASKPSASAATPVVSMAQKLAEAPPSAAAAIPALPRGLTLAHAAADSVATGDFSRAMILYRELARREPTNRAYNEAARILSERNPR